MQVDSKPNQDRRVVRYESMEELVADAERLAQTEVRTVGNWSHGQIYEHLARSFDSSIDGVGFSLPAPVRWLMTLFMKRKFLQKEIPAGFKTTGRFVPEETSVDAGLASLRAAVARQNSESSRAPHPAFGKIGRDDWTAFNLRHGELHMSYLVDGN